MAAVVGWRRQLALLALIPSQRLRPRRLLPPHRSPRPHPHHPPLTPSPEFAKGPSGSLIMLRRTRELVNCIRDGSVFEHPPRSVPKGRVYIQDFPNAGTVVFLNLLAYYLITRQSNRLRGA